MSGRFCLSAASAEPFCQTRATPADKSFCSLACFVQKARPSHRIKPRWATGEKRRRTTLPQNGVNFSDYAVSAGKSLHSANARCGGLLNLRVQKITTGGDPVRFGLSLCGLRTKRSELFSQRHKSRAVDPLGVEELTSENLYLGTKVLKGRI